MYSLLGTSSRDVLLVVSGYNLSSSIKQCPSTGSQYRVVNDIVLVGAVLGSACAGRVHEILMVQEDNLLIVTVEGGAGGSEKNNNNNENNLISLSLPLSFLFSPSLPLPLSLSLSLHLLHTVSLNSFLILLSAS